MGTKDFIQGGYVNNKVNPEYITRTEVGNEVGYFVGYEYAGVYKTQAEIDEDGFPNQASLKLGDSRYVDQNDDHVLDSKDYIKLGSAIPDFTYGLSGNFRYSNWDLTINVVGSQGNEIANMLKPFISQGEAYANLSPDRLNRYPVGDQPRMTVIDPNKNFFKMSNFYVEDGSFLKIKTVQIGYTLPKRLVNWVGLTNLRLYATGQNLFTFTKYSGFDPEISEYTPGNSNTSLAAGIDLANYPLPKSVIVGVNITF